MSETLRKYVVRKYWNIYIRMNNTIHYLRTVTGQSTDLGAEMPGKILEITDL